MQKINVFFIGPRACGKTTLAREVAKKTDRRFVDTDEEIIQQEAKTIAEIVQESGWVFFRKKEHIILSSICRQNYQSVATGGGIVLWPENRQLLMESGKIFYLKAKPDLLEARLKADPKRDLRPALQNTTLQREVEETLRQRESYYLQTSDYTLQADKPLPELVEDVLSILGEF